MSVHRRNRVDGNQAVVIAALRKIGARILNLSQVGGGCPDLLVAFRGRNILLEIKLPGKDESKEQIEFRKHWGGEVYTARSAEEAVRLVVGEKAMT